METPIIGKVLVTALVENMADLILAENPIIPSDQIRRVEVRDASVDTRAGATRQLAARARLTMVLVGARGDGRAPVYKRKLPTTSGSVPEGADPVHPR